MAERNFKIHQYDGSIDKEPDEHPNIFFQKYFVSSVPMEGPYKTIEQIIAENGHQQESNIILQIDVEGAEWDILKSLNTETLCKFKQIIIEFHNLEFSIYKYSILKKLRETHTPVHFHYNDFAQQLNFIPQLNFLYSGSLLEISYARNSDFTFTDCEEYFPTKMDHPNTGRYSLDIPIGYFGRLKSKLEVLAPFLFPQP